MQDLQNSLQAQHLTQPIREEKCLGKKKSPTWKTTKQFESGGKLEYFIQRNIFYATGKRFKSPPFHDSTSCYNTKVPYVALRERSLTTCFSLWLLFHMLNTIYTKLFSNQVLNDLLVPHCLRGFKFLTLSLIFKVFYSAFPKKLTNNSQPNVKHRGPSQICSYLNQTIKIHLQV